MLTYTTYAVPRADLGEAFHEYDVAGMNFLADQIFVPYDVQKEDGTISVSPRENLRMDETDRAEGGTFNRIDIQMEDLAYATKDSGLEIPITDRERRKYSDDFNIELEKTTILKTRMRLRREYNVAAAIFNTTTWTGSSLYTDNSGSPWDAAGTDIIGQVEAVKEIVRGNCGMSPNALIIGAATIKNLRTNTGIKAAFPGIAVLTRDILLANLPAILGVPNILVGNAHYNTADEGQSNSGADIWLDDYAMLAVLATPQAPMTTPAVARCLRWRAMADGLLVPEQYREEQTKSDILRVEDYLQDKVLDTYMAHLVKIDA